MTMHIPFLSPATLNESSVDATIRRVYSYTSEVNTADHDHHCFYSSYRSLRKLQMEKFRLHGWPIIEAKKSKLP